MAGERVSFMKLRSRRILLEENTIYYLLFFTGLGVISFDAYKTLNYLKSQFEVVALTPIFGAVLVILASLAIRNNDNKRKRSVAILRGEILYKLRKEDYIDKHNLFRFLSDSSSRRIFELAVDELKSENLISQDDDDILRIVDNANLDKYKYELALTINDLNRKISFGKELEYEIKSYINNPLKYSITDANTLLSAIRKFLNEGENIKDEDKEG